MSGDVGCRVVGDRWEGCSFIKSVIIALVTVGAVVYLVVCALARQSMHVLRIHGHRKYGSLKCWNNKLKLKSKYILESYI